MGQGTILTEKPYDLRLRRNSALESSNVAELRVMLQMMLNASVYGYDFFVGPLQCFFRGACFVGPLLCLFRGAITMLFSYGS
jgi:hypothetical protein